MWFVIFTNYFEFSSWRREYIRNRDTPTFKTFHFAHFYCFIHFLSQQALDPQLCSPERMWSSHLAPLLTVKEKKKEKMVVMRRKGGMRASMKAGQVWQDLLTKVYSCLPMTFKLPLFIWFKFSSDSLELFQEEALTQSSLRHVDCWMVLVVALFLIALYLVNLKEPIFILSIFFHYIA